MRINGIELPQLQKWEAFRLGPLYRYLALIEPRHEVLPHHD